MSAPYSAKAIANYFLRLAEREGEKISPMKLQKLIYFAHGWNLAVYGGPLISEQVQAWKYGPVIQSIYHEFKRFGAGPIKGEATSIDAKNFEIVTPMIDSGDKQTINLLDTVWRIYSGFSAIQLSNLTHRQGTPWEVTWKTNEGMLEIGIENDEIRKYFLAQAKKNAESAQAAG